MTREDKIDILTIRLQDAEHNHYRLELDKRLAAEELLIIQEALFELENQKPDDKSRHV